MAALHRSDWHHLNIAKVWPYANELRRHVARFSAATAGLLVPTIRCG